MLIPTGPFLRRAIGSGGPLFIPTALPHLELYLDSLIGLSGAHNSTPATWPDQSSNARNGNNTGGVKVKLQTTGAANLSPNGSQTMRFPGADPANGGQIELALNPAVYPTFTRGYTFYLVYNLAAVALSSTGIDMLWCEGANSKQRIVVRQAGKQGYRDNLGDHLTTEALSTGWQSQRYVWSAAASDLAPTGTVATYRDGVALTYANNTYTEAAPGTLSGYMVGQLASNPITGFTGLLAAFLWYSDAHSLATQVLVDNYLRGRFGLALI